MAGKKRAIERKATCHPDKRYHSKGLCRECSNAKYKKEHPRTKIQEWSSGLHVRYGITGLQWMKMFKRQSGHCPVCFRELYLPQNKEGKKAAAVDHDHKTKRVRGLVCFQCNRLRISNHTPDSAKRLYEYLSSDFDGRTI